MIIFIFLLQAHSISTAEAVGSNLIIANDPDADRLAVAEKVNGQRLLL